MNISIKKNLNLILLLLLLIGVSTFDDALARSGFTTIVYLGPGQPFLSSNPNTLFVKNGNVGIVSASRSGTRSSEINKTIRNLSSAVDYYITVTYDPKVNAVYIYNHGNRIGRIPLKGFNLNLLQFVDDLRQRYTDNDFAFYNEYERTFSSKQVRADYNQNYESARNAYYDSVK